MKTGISVCILCTVVGLARAADEPILTEEGLVYPEGADISRALTATERIWLETNPLSVLRGATPPPAYLADVRCPGEYEPTQGVLMAWEGSTGQNNILARMATHITTTGAADVYIMCDTASEATTVRNTIAGLTLPAANMDRVYTYVTTTDTIWIRDYGPRYIYEGDVRSIVDHTYNRPRPNDDLQPFFWGNLKKQTVYEIPLIHGGGNYHLNGIGSSWATRLIKNENPSLTEAQIIAHWFNYQHVTTTITDPFPTTVDSTQHIDMWMQIIGDNKVMISDWPNNIGSTQDNICDTVAGQMATAGWTVHRVDARSVSGVHYTYTNVVMCNNLVLIPSYSNTTVFPHNAPALAAWQAALPTKTIVQVDCQALVTSAGVMHCIMMHVPAPLGGTNPTAYLRTLRGPETLQPGSNVDIRWSTDDDVGAVNVDVLLSLDGGSTWPVVIASATADDGHHTWTVPNTYTTQGRIRIVARDAQGNTGSDSSRDDLFINAPPPHCLGDADNNGVINFNDITMILSNFGQTGSPGFLGDSNADGVVDFADITTTLAAFGGAC